MIGLEINARKSPQGNQAPAPTSLVALLCLLAASLIAWNALLHHQKNNSLG
jgi:hypothetical protein